MKPIAIVRFLSIEEPGYFTTYLDNKHIPWQLIKIDAGEALPTDINQFSGLVLMGGSMSVNDDIPWIKSILTLIQQAMAGDVPVLGHCLGGQLISKALGGEIKSNSVPEMGWGATNVANNPVAHEWFDGCTEFESFHWHGEMFSIPNGATRLLSSRYCENQAFAIGIHLAMQCHVEMTAEMVRNWCSSGEDEIASQICPSVQSSEEMLIDLPERITRLNKVAGLLYEKWLVGLKH